MVKEGDKEKELEKLKGDIQKTGEEIERLKKTIEELSAKIHEKEETGKNSELSNVIGEVSKLLEESFNIFGISSRGQGVTRRTGGLVGLINDLVRLAEKSGTLQKEFDLEGKKGIIDFRIRSGPLKRSAVTRRGIYTKKPLRGEVERHSESFKPKTVKAIEEREPIVDIFEEEDKITVMAELPGVVEKDIDWNVEGDTLTIKTNTLGKKYYKEIVLPAPAEKKGAESTYRNGILEVKLIKTLKEDLQEHI